MDKFISVELDRFGFMIDSYWFYLSISWQLIGIGIALVVARRFYLKRVK